MSLSRGQTGTKHVQAEIDAQATIAAAAAAAKQPLTGNGFTVATVPAAADNIGRTIYVADGAAGSPCGAISDGTDWLRITVGAAVAIA